MSSRRIRRPVTVVDKREWLRQYEEGKSESLIGKSVGRDVKTVKKGINDARLERDSAAARSTLITESLRKHHSTIGELVHGIVAALKLPPYDVETRRDQDGKHVTTPLPGGATIEYELNSGLMVFLSGEGSPHWELLREHLKRDRLWGLLDRWKASLTAHMQARTALRIGVTSLLQGTNGFTLVPETSKDRTEGCIYPSAVHLFYEIMIKRALGIPDSTNLEGNLETTSDGYVTHVGNRLAYCPGTAEECKDKLIGVLKKLQTSADLKRVSETRETLVQAADKAKRPIEEIELLGMIPGHCRVCRRLGM